MHLADPTCVRRQRGDDWGAEENKLGIQTHPVAAE